MAKKAPAPLSALELHALKLAGKTADKVRGELNVGEDQAVDFVVRISGAINVAGDSKRPGVTTPNAENVLAFVLAQVSPRVRDRITDAVRLKYADFVGGGEEPKPDEKVLAAAKTMLAGISTKVTKTSRGAVTADLAVDVIERPKAKSSRKKRAA